MTMYNFSSRRTRRGMSVVEIMVAITTLGIALALVGRASMVVNQYNRTNDIKTKRAMAMQQQLNFIGALPYTSLVVANVPAAKSFTTGDFSYTRRVSLAVSGNATAVTLTIVPATGIAKDTLLNETVSFVRTNPPCGTVLNTR
jgi:Tfp pilus assembly protein PilE